MHNFSIKKANAQHLSSLQKVGRQTFLETYASGNTEADMEAYLQEEFSIKKLKEELSDPNSEFYLALTEDKIVGYIKLNSGAAQTDIKDKNAMEIQRIYVLKEYQGKQIGIALHTKALEIAKQKKLDYLWLGVWEENPKAIQFYEKIGFIAFDKHVFKLGKDEQTDIMMKKIIAY